MKKKNYLKLLIPLLVLFAGIVSFSSPSALSTSETPKKQLPAVVFKIAAIEEDTLSDAANAEELESLYEYLLSAGLNVSDEFMENFYPAVVFTVRAAVIATRALTRNTPVLQQLTQGFAAFVGNVLANLLFFGYAANGIEEKALEKNLEGYKIYCLQ